MSLTKHQQEATDAITDFLRDPYAGGTYFTLVGPPGSGKTYLLNQKLAKMNPREVVAATVGHSAKAVLADGLSNKIAVMTLASLLGMKVNYDKYGQIRFKAEVNTKKPISKYKYLILDEVSMIDDTLFHIIRAEANKFSDNKIKIVAVGDPYQLPPVEQDHDSKYFDNIGYNLVDSLRYTGPIDELAKVFRSTIDAINAGGSFDKWTLNNYTQRKPNIDSSGAGYSFTNNVQELIEMASDSFTSNKSDVNAARVLAFKNESIDLLNKHIRKHMFGTDLAQFEPGELVISTSNYSPNSQPTVYNRQVLRVEDYTIEKGQFGIKTAVVKFSNLDHSFLPKIRVVSTDDGGESLKQYNRVLNIHKSAAKRNPELWPDYYKFVNSFAYFDYSYALNLYKAQGVTLSKVYVCEGEVMEVKPLSWKQKFQALYVAMTRPKENLVIYNADF